MGTLKSELYTALAEALADPPDWLALPGREWPLYSISGKLAIRSQDVRQALMKMGQIPAEPLAVRRERYDALFSGPGRPRVWLYESLYRSGNLFGPETMEVENIYRAAGLVPDGAELPDHASLELAFLAYLAGQPANADGLGQAWQELERKFIQRHAGRWLPALGRDLAGSQDEVYAPVGQFLVGWLAEAARPSPCGNSHSSSLWALKITQIDDCNLCGFCVQVCPRHALAMRENSMETVLVSAGSSCSGCRKCERICPANALRVDRIDARVGNPVELAVLCSSPRAHCPRCGQPTVSRAEIETIVEKIGPQPWIELCQECRLALLEDVR